MKASKKKPKAKKTNKTLPGPPQKSRSTIDQAQYPKKMYVFFYPQTGRMRTVVDYPKGCTLTMAETMAHYMDAELRVKED